MTADPAGFPARERRLLLSLPRIGERVVQRIEAQGVVSLQDLRRRGVDRVVRDICRDLGTPAWSNRRRAIAEALNALSALPPSEA